MTMPFSQSNQALAEVGREKEKPLFMVTSTENSCNIGSPSNLKGDESEWKCVTTIRENDVLLGRGSRSNQPGNVKFRQVIKDNRFRYLAASKIDKPKIAEDVVRIWRNLNPPGRFLARKDEDEVKGNSEKKDEHAVWFDVGDKKARLKTSMALRERTPEAVDYLQMIRKQEVEETHRSTMLVKQQLEFGTPYPEPRYVSREGHLSHSVSERPLAVPAPQPPPSRRYSFAGFPHRRLDGSANSKSSLHPPPQHHPSMLNHHQHHPQMHTSGSCHSHRRSSLMGERQAQLYMMQQQVHAQRMRLELEMEHAEMEDREYRMAVRRPCTMPAIADQHESEHSNSSSTEPIHNMSTGQLLAVSSETSPFVPDGHPPQKALSSGSLGRSSINELRVRNTPRRSDVVSSHSRSEDVDFDIAVDLTPVEAEEYDGSEDMVVLEKFRTLLQGWADRDKLTAASNGGEASDMDDEMESVRSPPRKRGVDRTISGCSVQSALSDLMAMSIITSGTEDEGLSLDRSGHHEIWFD